MNASYSALPAPVNPHKVASPALTDAIATIESDFGERMRTHDGDHTGWHMMSRKAWEDVSKALKSQGHVRYPYSNAMDYKVSSYYCTEYLNLLERQLREALGRDPTLEEVLAAYRGGFNHLKHLDFKASVYWRYIAAVKKHLK